MYMFGDTVLKGRHAWRVEIDVWGTPNSYRMFCALGIISKSSCTKLYQQHYPDHPLPASASSSTSTSVSASPSASASSSTSSSSSPPSSSSSKKEKQKDAMYTPVKVQQGRSFLDPTFYGLAPNKRYSGGPCLSSYIHPDQILSEMPVRTPIEMLLDTENRMLRYHHTGTHQEVVFRNLPDLDDWVPHFIMFHEGTAIHVTVIHPQAYGRMEAIQEEPFTQLQAPGLGPQWGLL